MLWCFDLQPTALLVRVQSSTNFLLSCSYEAWKISAASSCTDTLCDWQRLTKFILSFEPVIVLALKLEWKLQ